MERLAAWFNWLLFNGEPTNRTTGEYLGVRVDLLTREEAALLMLEQEVTFKWRPVIIEPTGERNG
jgi:hypothetical protein